MTTAEPLRCAQCDMEHRTVTETEVHCVACRWFLSVRIERRSLAEALEFMRSKCLCVYCGDYAAEIEHVIPRVSRLPTYTVPSCRECNGIAGGLLFIGLKQKSEYIRSRLRKRYKHVLSTPHWTPSQLSEMSYSLQKKIGASLAAKRQIKRRVEFEWISELLASSNTSSAEVLSG